MFYIYLKKFNKHATINSVLIHFNFMIIFSSNIFYLHIYKFISEL